MCIALPFIFIIAILIYIKYPGSFFYTQLREGKNGKPFKILKLRTMVSDSSTILENMLENDNDFAKTWKETGVIKNDPRIAGTIGRLCRQLSIDEIPQLINIIKGEMAFIGPRPLEIEAVETLNPETRKLRNSILPGITGLMQVNFRSASFRQMLFYDRIYIKNQNICLDSYILYKTIFAVLKKTGE